MMDVSDGDTGNFDEETPEIKFHHEMISKPIVYTTKLDEMKVFRDKTTSMSIDNTINAIVKESKPKLNCKRKCTDTTYSHYSYDDLACYINNFNKKVAKISKHNKNMLSMCRPVKIVLEDIKNLLRKRKTNNRINKIVKTKYSVVSDRRFPAYCSRKLHSRIIYDQQNKEADLYALDKSHFIQVYARFRIDESNAKLYQLLKMDKSVTHFSCCCWYKREKCLATFPLAPHETLRFMRKPHKCAINHCRCCCRNKGMTNAVRPSSLKSLESHSVWLNRMIEVHTSLPDKSKRTLPSKSMSKLNFFTHFCVVEDQTTPILHSTNIDFGCEFYSIGADGHIKLCLKNTANYQQNLLNLKWKTVPNIMGDICCWYKREEFAGRLLTLGALSNTVNYIRSVHSCSPINCNCCCKPSNTEKLKLSVLSKSARHTVDSIAKKLIIKLKLSEKAKISDTPKKPNNFVSFNFSLSALDMISESTITPDVLDSITPESVTLDNKNRFVRVFVEKSQKHKILIECTQLNSFTTKELRILDMIFQAANKALLPKDEIKYRARKSVTYTYHHKMYPLLLNEQLSVTADLRSKRFMPSLRTHLEKTGTVLPESCMKNLRGGYLNPK